MPATKSKTRKKTSKVAPAKRAKASASQVGGSTVLVVAALCGAVFGLSAPGFDQWYLAWVGLVPFLLLTVSSSGIKEAFVRGLVFAFAYDLVYLNWYMHLHPLEWLGFNVVESVLVAGAAWVIVSLHQALITALIAVVIRILPLTGGFIPRVVEEKICLPAPLVIPALWVLVQNKIANAHDFLGVPWPMVEYSQYKLLPVLQVTSWIGGIGLGALIIMANVVLAGLIASASQRLSFKSLSSPTFSTALVQALTAALCIAGIVAWGYSRLGAPQLATENLSVVQGNINIEMEKRTHSYTLSQLADHYATLVDRTPPGICIWTESALPTYLKEEHDMLTVLGKMSHDGHRAMVIGSLDRDFDGRPYNSAFGIDNSGHLAQPVYHKRYLVPFGEYMPGFVHYLPEWIQRLTSTPAGTGFNSGKTPVVLDLGGEKIAPLICFETLSPELVVSSVRNGGHLLVNLSDLAWFHDSMVGDQMVAFSVLRAVETGRYFVFAANTGPSAIIDSNGRIVSRSGTGKATILSGKVRMSNELTPFTQWFN